MASTKVEESDADLYDDLYGDDDNEFAIAVEDGSAAPGEGDAEQQEQQENQVEFNMSSSLTNSTAPLTSNQHPHGTMSLPARPNGSGTNTAASNAASNAAALSYSAQIARQFSQYQQTPSQERQGQALLQQQRGDFGGTGARMAMTGLQSTGNAPSTAPSGTQPIQSFAGSSHEGPLSSGSADSSVFGKKPSEMHDHGKLFVGGLNWDTTDEALRDYFSQFGKVDACTIMRDPAGTSRGFAFMTFEDAASVNGVVTREHFLDGKSIDPKRAIPREEHLRNTRYFVGGLAPATTSESMRAFFAAYGKVVDATVMVDRESTRSKGFGFVTFEDATNADQLVGKIGLMLDDKQIEVKMAQPRSQRDQTRAAVASGNTVPNRDPQFNDRDSRTPTSGMTPFINPGAQTNQMNLMYRNPGMNPMMGGMMMNPMMMGMGMNGMGGMMNGMGMMGGMNGMNMSGMGMGGMGGMNGMRMGMSPMMGMPAMGGQMGGMGGMMRPGMTSVNSMTGGSATASSNTASSGVGPARTNTRNHAAGFHPYSR